MTDQAPERARGGGGNVLTGRGPFGLAVWVWMLLTLAMVGGVVLLYRTKKATNAAAATSGTAADTTAPTGTSANDVPQFVNQTFTTVAAPEQTTVNMPTQSPPPKTPPPRPEPPEPITISGSPGSYTTNIPGGKAEWTSTGKYSLNTIAKSHQMTAQQLINLSLASQNNVGLKAYVAKRDYNAKIPAGVQLFFPADKWAIPKKPVAKKK